MKNHSVIIKCFLFACAVFATCTIGTTSVQADLIWNCPEPVPETEEKQDLNYLVLVSKQSQLPETWEKDVELVHMTNSLGDDVEVEKKAYESYLNLKDALAEEDVFVDLDSAYRSVAAQQQIADEFTEKYGKNM